MFFLYSNELRTDIEAALSLDRLAVYRQAVAGNLACAIDLYCWNAATAAAFFGPIGVMEVALRNALDRELARVFTAPWYDDPKFLAVDSTFQQRIQDTKKKITARGKIAVRSRMIAELSFGFWVNLVRPGPGGSYVRSLWGPALSRAFRPQVKRSFVAGRLDPLLRFRKRVAHHEPIFSLDLDKQYASIRWIIDQVAPNIVPWVDHHARVSECIANGPRPPKTRW